MADCAWHSVRIAHRSLNACMHLFCEVFKPLHSHLERAQSLLAFLKLGGTHKECRSSHWMARA